MPDVISSFFNIPEIDAFHTHPSDLSNVRYYHFLKASIVKSFILKHKNKKAVFLDAGAGRGPYSAIASDLYAHIHLHEYDLGELDAAKKNLADKIANDPQHFSVAEVDIRNMPIEDNTVDVGICSEVLEHIPHQEKAMAELYRVMKPGGRLLFSMPNAFSLFYYNVRLKSNHQAILRKMKESGGNLSSPEEAHLPYPEWEMIRHISFPFWKIESLARSAGFIIKKRRGANILPMPTKIRSLFLRYSPFLFRMWVRLDRLVGKINPMYGSFYFLELEKPKA